MDKSISNLQHISRQIRKDIILSLAEAGSGHLGGSLGLADIFTTLYFKILNHDPKKPNWSDRDRFILSIGHVAPVLYTTLAHAEYFPKEELFSLRKLNSRLQGHPGRDHGLPGIELSAGSLGQGLSVSVGLALSAKMDKRNHFIYTILGDGELQEGSVWEAAMSAAHYKLDNLIAIVDYNGVQIDGNTSEVMNLEPLNEKWKAFGWEVLVCNGHNYAELISNFTKAKKVKGKPTVILAKTKMGKGVPEIEGDCRWHGKTPNKEEAERFVKALNI